MGGVLLCSFNYFEPVVLCTIWQIAVTPASCLYLQGVTVELDFVVKKPIALVTSSILVY